MLEPHQRLIDDSLQRLDIGLRRIVDDAQLTVERRLTPHSTALNPVEPRLCGGAIRRWPRIDDASAGKPRDGITVTLKKGVITATTTSATRDTPYAATHIPYI